MKPAVFDYHRPETLDDALSLLAELGEDAKVLAGGQSLVPLMNMRLARPDHIIDLARVPSLRGISVSSESVSLGAMVRHRELETSDAVRAALPLLVEAAGLIAHFQIRERGTVGGSLAHADPAAELPLVAALLGATIQAQSPGGSRTIPAGEFFVSVFTTALEESEVIASVDFPRLPQGHGWAIEEVARRHGDFAIVSAAAVVSASDGRFDSARVALGGVGPTPVTLDLEAALVGEPVSVGAIRTAATAAASQIEPRGDIHASADDRRDLTRSLVVRALTTATERAGHRLSTDSATEV